MAFHGLDVGQFGAARRHELMVDRFEPFADNEQAGLRQQMMDVGDTAGHRVLDRDHAEIGLARADRGERVFKGRAGQRLGVGIGFDDGKVGVRALLALECDFHGFGRCIDHGAPCSSRSVFRQYPSGDFQVGGGVDAARHRVDDADIDPHAGLQRPKLLEFFPPLQRRGSERHETPQRFAPVGVKTDVMVMRPIAPGRGGAGKIQRAQPPRAGPASRPSSPHWGWCVPPRHGFRRPMSRCRPPGRPAGRARCECGLAGWSENRPAG